jgi:hypothetical protein
MEAAQHGLVYQYAHKDYRDVDGSVEGFSDPNRSEVESVLRQVDACSNSDSISTEGNWSQPRQEYLSHHSPDSTFIHQTGNEGGSVSMLNTTSISFRSMTWKSMMISISTRWETASSPSSLDRDIYSPQSCSRPDMSGLGEGERHCAVALPVSGHQSGEDEVASIFEMCRVTFGAIQFCIIARIGFIQLDIASRGRAPVHAIGKRI